MLDGAGRVVGRKFRAEVHRDGDWHGLVFVWSAWAAGGDGGGRMVLQQRARPGDPFAAQVDALAGGHIGAGESPADAARRELTEEVGLTAGADDFVHLGTNRMDRPAGDCRRVHQHLLLYPVPLDLGQLRFCDEVGGFLEVDVAGFEQLVRGQRQALPARGRFARDGGRARDLDLPRAAVGGYPDEILDTFRRSLASIRTWLRDGRVDPRHFDPKAAG